MNINSVIYAVIALVVVGALASVGITSINNANTTGWDSTQITLFSLIATFFVIGLLLAFIPKIGKKG